jgi:hypothetical protein
MHKSMSVRYGHVHTVYVHMSIIQAYTQQSVKLR